MEREKLKYLVHIAMFTNTFWHEQTLDFVLLHTTNDNQLTYGQNINIFKS
jgi:hypothetical protein